MLEQALTSPPRFEPLADGDRSRLRAAGSWTTDHADALETLAGEFSATPTQFTLLDVASVEKLDTFGAWVIERVMRSVQSAGGEIQLAAVPTRYRGLLDKVHGALRNTPSPRRRPSGLLSFLDKTGRATSGAVADLAGIVAMAGALAIALARGIARPRHFRLTSIVHHLDRVGWQAIGIILLITFLIGAIIAQQGIFNFRRFGAQDYVVNLVGILVLREIGVLIVAIMVAGRSGSSYTAELGSMKMREEVDALRTMGIDPIEILVLPRVIALVIALPVLTFLGSMAALLGGELVAWFYGGMSPTIFLTRLRDAVSLHDFYIGMIKAPVMAFVIGIVACAEGLKVKGSAESLGLQTTASVVKSIFLVIVLDGVFAIFFASIGW
jgi:phospholipid/cholesterol/gamma-HCH transport system permease protein